MKFSFLIENKTETSDIVAEHGLSIYIEARGKKILFDAGASGLFAENAREMRVDLADVDFAVVSHGHYDHTSGMPVFCDINRKAPVYIHKNAFRRSYGYENGKMDEEQCGIEWTDAEKARLADRLIYTERPVYVTEDIGITGTVAVDEDFIPTEKFSYYDESGALVDDDMSHEQCLVIREPEGLYVFSGCSHRGVLNGIRACKNMFPGDRIAAVIAGMHLYSATDEDRKRVVDEIASEGLDMVIPVHCTGIDAICDLKAKLGKSCIVATAGKTYSGESTAGRKN